MVPNSNGRKPLTTTTATLRSMVTRPAGAHPATDPATDRHDLKYARGIGRMSSNNGITATGRASRGEATWTHGHVLGFQPGPPGPRRSQRDELREQAGHATEAWLRPGRVGPGAGHVRRIPDAHGGHDPARTVRPAPGDRPPGQVAAPGALAAADRALPGDRGEHPPQVTGPGGVTGQPDGVVADPAPQPAQQGAGRALDQHPGVLALVAGGAVFHLHLARRRADRPCGLAGRDRDRVLATLGRQVFPFHLGELLR